MMFPDSAVVERIRKEYPAGTSVELVEMDDPYCTIPVGLKGVVQFVDDAGTIFVDWQNGHHLGVVYGVDFCRKLVDDND